MDNQDERRLDDLETAVSVLGADLRKAMDRIHTLEELVLPPEMTRPQPRKR